LTEVFAVEKGIGSGPSPPTISLANALTAVEVCFTAAGLKAAADPARAAATRRNLVMVDIVDLLGVERVDYSRERAEIS
jgi:hypothetical protein